MKGMNSQGGSIAIGAQPPQQLYGGVQNIQVTSGGPVWELLPVDRVLADGFEGAQ